MIWLVDDMVPIDLYANFSIMFFDIHKKCLPRGWLTAIHYIGVSKKENPNKISFQAFFSNQQKKT